MPGDKKHHTDKFRRCVDEVEAKGGDVDAYAVCTASLKKAGEPIFEGAEAGSAEELRLLGGHESLEELHICGATGKSRTEMRDGREYLVVPVVALMEGVIHPVNADNPEFVPLSTLKRAAPSWNGRPVTIGHPTRDGKQCSANDPSIFESHVIGTIFESRNEGKKLLQEAWIEKSKARKLHPSMLADLEANKQVEVSVGTFVVTSAERGEFEGKAFKAKWLDASGDHLALLPGGRGACSCEMGCGTARAAMHFVAAESFELLPEDPDWAAVILWALAASKKMVECTMCKGSGSKDGNPCEACEGNGEIRAAAGARHSSSDMKMIQTMHDHACALGAACDRKNLETAAVNIHPIKHEGGKYVLYSKDGQQRLAEHGTLKAAEEHGLAIQQVLVQKAS